MYEPSLNFYTTVVQNQTRRISWGGTITADGTTYSFGANHIVSKSGRITNEISGSSMELGTVYSSELDIGIYIDDIGVPRDKIYGAEIVLNCTLTANNVTGTVPMGVFSVVEATQKGNVCSIVAYDRMSLFDIDYPVVSGAQTPYEWALSFCETCGVTLGTTEGTFSGFPNGDLVLTLTWDDGIKTYRDALGMLAGAVGCSAHFDRNGELVFYPLKSSGSVATLRANDRYGSDIAQTSWTPSSVYVTNVDKGTLTKAGNGDLVIDLGDNAFLQNPGEVRDIQWQIISTVSVSDMLTDILADAGTLAAVPVEADIPLDPCLDLFDSVTLTGGQANNDNVLITSLIHTIGGGTEIKCSGANTTEEPKPSGSSGASRSDELWLITTHSADEINIETHIVKWGELDDDKWGDLVGDKWGDFYRGGQESIIAQGYFEPPKEMNRGVIAFSVNYTLDENAKVTYTIYINDTPEWVVEETQTAGKIAKTITTPCYIWMREAGGCFITATMKGESL